MRNSRTSSRERAHLYALQFLDFTRSIAPDFSNYDEEGECCGFLAVDSFAAANRYSRQLRGPLSSTITLRPPGHEASYEIAATYISNFAFVILFDLAWGARSRCSPS